MKIFFNKIYYAFSKTERWINLTKRKGDFSWGILLDIFAGFEFGISTTMASLLTYMFIKNYCNYIIIIPFALLFIFYYIIRKYVKKENWEVIDKQLWPIFEEDVFIPKWIAIGIITELFSFVCAIGGGLLFFLSLFHIYEN